jgi:hypothetical protein
MKVATRISVLFAACSLGTVCCHAAQTNATAREKPDSDDYTIQAGDVWGGPNVGGVCKAIWWMKIRDDGAMAVPRIGDLSAVGRTVTDVNIELRARFGSIAEYMVVFFKDQRGVIHLPNKKRLGLPTSISWWLPPSVKIAE